SNCPQKKLYAQSRCGERKRKTRSRKRRLTLSLKITRKPPRDLLRPLKFDSMPRKKRRENSLTPISRMDNRFLRKGGTGNQSKHIRKGWNCAEMISRR